MKYYQTKIHIVKNTKSKTYYIIHTISILTFAIIKVIKLKRLIIITNLYLITFYSRKLREDKRVTVKLVSEDIITQK